jgi:hypothetical protein
LALPQVLVPELPKLPLDDDLPAIVRHEVGSLDLVLPVRSLDDPRNQLLEVILAVTFTRHLDDASAQTMPRLAASATAWSSTRSKTAESGASATAWSSRPCWS